MQPPAYGIGPICCVYEGSDSVDAAVGTGSSLYHSYPCLFIHSLYLLLSYGDTVENLKYSNWLFSREKWTCVTSVIYSRELVSYFNERMSVDTRNGTVREFPY